MHKIRTLFLSWCVKKSSLIALRWSDARSLGQPRTGANLVILRDENTVLILCKRFCQVISSLHPEKTGEKRFYYKQDVSPSRASSAKQRTEWGGKELHTGIETTRHRCPGARYGKQVGGGGE